ncbi:MAG: hypothetical protein RR806_05025 [Oscillospiraceae bacterium]
MYKCELCGKEHKTVEERAKCELRCFASIKEKDKLNEQKRLQTEEATDLNEIQNLCDEFDRKFTERGAAFEKKYNKIIRLKNLTLGNFTTSGWF